LLVQLGQQAQALRGEWEQHRQQLLQWVEQAEALMTAKQVGVCVSLAKDLQPCHHPLFMFPGSLVGMDAAVNTFSTVQPVQYRTAIGHRVSYVVLARHPWESL
jgi:hypothetical protein